MTCREWRSSLYGFLLWSGALWYALRYVHNAWGLVILAGFSLAAFWLLVQTVDLLFGRWIRQAPGRRVRRIIVEEVEY
jgi:hypothetical protein